MTDRYFKDTPMDALNRGLFAFASYNAGPAKVARLRKEAAAAGLNPNVWFNHVEVIAARRIGRETVQYVSNIYKYYVAYSLLREEREEREQAKESLQKR
jgi:membrane-bound lytic murein transglycosylase MltF